MLSCERIWLLWIAICEGNTFEHQLSLHNDIAGNTFERQLSLQEIQRKEREQENKDRVAKAAAERQRQQEMEELNNQQTQLKWAATKSQ